MHDIQPTFQLSEVIIKMVFGIKC